MIAVTIKHMLFDACLNRVFDEIFRNFHIAQFNLMSYKLGDHLKLKIVQDGINPVQISSCVVIYKEGTSCIIKADDFSPSLFIYITDTTVTEMSTRPPLIVNQKLC